MGEEETVLNWAEIIEKRPSSEAESTTGQELEGVHIPLVHLHSTRGVCGQTELEQLVEALPFVETVDNFVAVVEGSPRQAIEDAIFFQPEPQRSQLTQWLEVLDQPAEEVEPQPVQVRVGDRLRLAKNLFATTKGKVVQVLESFGDLFETTFGAVSLAEVESGTWELVTG
jgi:hypothetical protein